MDREKMKSFNLRAFVALMAAVSGGALPFTGVAVHLVHHGPIGPGSNSWMAAHWVLGVIFTVFTVWHVYLNRRLFFKYMRGLTANAPAVSRELIVAFTVVGVIVLALVLHVCLGH